MDPGDQSERGVEDERHAQPAPKTTIEHQVPGCDGLALGTLDRREPQFGQPAIDARGRRVGQLRPPPLVPDAEALMRAGMGSPSWPLAGLRDPDDWAAARAEAFASTVPPEETERRPL